MKKFFDTFKNIFSIEELRTRILYTLGFLVVFRLGSFIVLPGVNPEAVSSNADATGLLGIINTFSGGAFSNVSVLGLGIMPYITASIVLQLLIFAIPSFQKMNKDGESGRRQINNYTRLLTVIVAVGQSIGYLATYVKPEMIVTGMDSTLFVFTRVICLVAGTMFCLWLGEKITEKGIGNGVSMLIMIGIISRLPQSILIEVGTKGLKGSIQIIIEIAAFFLVVMGVVAITQAVRRIPLQYAKQIVGNSAIGGSRQYLPLKLIGAGVMPIIFAQSVMFLPALIGSLLPNSEFVNSMNVAFSDFTSWQYNLATATLIIVFTFFYTAVTPQLNPRTIAEDLKRNNAQIAGVKQGDATADEIDRILSKITFPGAIFLAMIAAMPALAYILGVQREFAYFYGGTSLLIMVGVIIDTITQIDSYLNNRMHDGFMTSSEKAKGVRRTQRVAAV